MGLQLKTIEPVEFENENGEKKMFMPKLDNEQKLRLETRTFGDDAEQDAKFLASCFDVKEGEKNWLIGTIFLLSEYDRQVLRTYLLNGESGVETLKRALDKVLDKNLEKEG